MRVLALRPGLRKRLDRENRLVLETLVLPSQKEGPSNLAESEQRIHGCGIATDRVKSFKVLTIQAVNQIDICVHVAVVEIAYFLL